MGKVTACLGLTLLLFTPCLAAEDPEFESIPVLYEEVMQATSIVELDHIYYPSGMQLPTKYWDLLCLSVDDVSERVPEQVILQFLRDNFPTDSGNYTQAEVRAAYIYSYLLQLYFTGSSEAEEYTKLVELQNHISFGFRGEPISTTSISNLHKLKAQVVLNEGLLRSTSSSMVQATNEEARYTEILLLGEDNVVYSLGYELPSSRPIHRMVDFITTREQYLEKMGLCVEQVAIALDLSAFEHYMGATLTNTLSVVEYAPTQRYVGEVNSAISASSFSSERIYGIQDFILDFCIFVVVVCLVILGALDFVRRRKDPLYGYLK